MMYKLILKRKTRSAFLYGFTAVVTFASLSISAEPFTLDPEAEPATLIEFRSEPGIGERVARSEGTVDETGIQLFLKELNVMAPLAIQVFSKDPAKKIDVSLHRLMWAEDDWRGATDANGDWGYLGRAHDEVGIALSAAEPTEYYVLAWQGPAPQQSFGLTALAPIPDQVTGANDADSSGFVRILSYVGVAAIAFILALFFARRKTDSSAAGMLLVVACFAASNTTEAQVPVVEDDGFASRLLAAESRLQEMETALLDVQKEAALATDDLRVHVEFVEDMVFENYDEIMQLGIQTDEFQATVDRSLDNLRAKDRSLERRIRALETLIEEDQDAELDPTHGGASLMSSCNVEPGGDITHCDTCFTEVNARLSERMHNFERLRVIYDSTATLIRYATTYGDAHSGWHQLEQAKWYEVRNNIIRSFSGTQRAYQQKYQEFGHDLKDVLQDLHYCEATTGGIQDWYARWGNLFYTMIMTRYQRD